MDALLLHDIAFAAAARAPHRVAFSKRGDHVTFGELADRIQHVAMVLAAKGVKHGDRVAWWGETSIDSGPLHYGLAVLGAVFVPLNPRFTPDEARTILDLVDPRFVVHDATHDGDVDIDIDTLLSAPRPSTVDLPEVDENDPAVIFCTSGTTGTPKGCVLSHRCHRLRTNTKAGGTTARGPVMTIFPQFHWGGWSFTHAAWYVGNELALVDGGDTTDLLETMHNRRVTHVYAIPAIWRRILEADRSAYDLTALRQADTGTSATPIELLHAIHAAFPDTTTTIGYGATEAGGLCVLANDDIERKPGSVGLPMPGLHVRIEEGELWVRSPMTFSGYFRNPEATAEVMVDGWYRTGDLVERDDEGYISVVGRVKDMIRTGGEYVAPAEVDVVLQRHPSVADGAVAGIVDDDWGEVIAAFVVLRPGCELDLATLRRHCETDLAAFKHPRRVYVVDRIPRTGPTGQVQRRRLAELARSIDDQAAVAR